MQALKNIPVGHNIRHDDILYTWTPHMYRGRVVYHQNGDPETPCIFAHDDIMVRDAGLSETYLRCIGAPLPRTSHRDYWRDGRHATCG